MVTFFILLNIFINVITLVNGSEWAKNLYVICMIASFVILVHTNDFIYAVIIPFTIIPSTLLVYLFLYMFSGPTIAPNSPLAQVNNVSTQSPTSPNSLIQIKADIQQIEKDSDSLKSWFKTIQTQSKLLWQIPLSKQGEEIQKQKAEVKKIVNKIDLLIDQTNIDILLISQNIDSGQHSLNMCYPIKRSLEAQLNTLIKFNEECSSFITFVIHTASSGKSQPVHQRKPKRKNPLIADSVKLWKKYDPKSEEEFWLQYDVLLVQAMQLSTASYTRSKK